MTPTSADSVAFDPLLGWPLLAVLGGVGLVLVLLGLRAGARGTIWRLGSVLVVLAALANPALIEEQRKPIADVALVVVDDSDSMAIGDRRPISAYFAATGLERRDEISFAIGHRRSPSGPSGMMSGSRNRFSRNGSTAACESGPPS